MFIRRLYSIIILIAFAGTICVPMPPAYASDFELSLPAPGTIINLSPAYAPAHLVGLQIDSQDPFRMDFLISNGQKNNGIQTKEQYLKMIKYFMASLTVPNNNQWVNLSPYESKRIISDELGTTEMGTDLLSQDYLLKQLTASLIYPETAIGKKFWKEIYRQINAKYGPNVTVPVNTFNKVWIMPESAVLYEKGNQVWIVKSSMNVMLESDYLSSLKHQGLSYEGMGVNQNTDVSGVGTDIIRNIIVPILKKEVNEGKNFATLRQMYNAMVLATWYKQELKQSILTRVYGNTKKMGGINLQDKKVVENIYQQYLKAYKKGVFNYIKEDIDPLTQQTVPRKYFSGGYTNGAMASIEKTFKNAEDLNKSTTFSERAQFNADTAQVVSLKTVFKSTARGLLNLVSGLMVLSATATVTHAQNVLLELPKIDLSKTAMLQGKGGYTIGNITPTDSSAAKKTSVKVSVSASTSPIIQPITIDPNNLKPMDRVIIVPLIRTGYINSNYVIQPAWFTDDLATIKNTLRQYLSDHYTNFAVAYLTASLTFDITSIPISKISTISTLTTVELSKLSKGGFIYIGLKANHINKKDHYATSRKLFASEGFVVEGLKTSFEPLRAVEIYNIFAKTIGKFQEADRNLRSANTFVVTPPVHPPGWIDPYSAMGLLVTSRYFIIDKNGNPIPTNLFLKTPEADVKKLLIHYTTYYPKLYIFNVDQAYEKAKGYMTTEQKEMWDISNPEQKNLKFADKTDNAMISKTNGGINFDAAQLNMQIKRDGQGMPLPINFQNPDLLDIQGLFPVVLNIQLMPQSDIPRL